MRTPTPAAKPAAGQRTPAPAAKPAAGMRTPAPVVKPATGQRASLMQKAEQLRTGTRPVVTQRAAVPATRSTIGQPASAKKTAASRQKFTPAAAVITPAPSIKIAGRGSQAGMSDFASFHSPAVTAAASGTPANLAVTEHHVLGVKDLRKRFGRKEVVRGVNFSMRNGEVAGLLGPNGAGKTTIFYMIVGFYRPSSGIVIMDDIDITAKPMYRRARQGIAYLPQEASIFRKLTVEQNIWAILESRRDIKKAEKKERLESLLDEFGIGRIRSQFGFTLSGGERRRTEIARALATEPKFLLLDEPFAGIDPIAVYEIKQIIRRLAEKGIGILITDHNVRDTLEITTEAFIIADGSIVARGDREVILADEMVREVYLGSEFKM
jgi:lipopolysaccharide export system ATP-binding protein